MVGRWRIIARPRGGRKCLHGCCQINANQSPKYYVLVVLGRQLAPLSQGSRAVLLEDGAAVEVTVEIEMIVD